MTNLEHSGNQIPDAESAKATVFINSNILFYKNCKQN